MLSNHKDILLTEYPEKQFLYLALYGSQNYGLAGKDSDIDTKAIIVPTLRDVASAGKPESRKLSLDNGEQIDVKDVRVMFSCFRKQNNSYLETLYTKHYIYNPLYKDEIEYMRDNADIISSYNPYLLVKCIKGMAYEKQHALEHPYPSKLDILDKYGYDPKQLSHILRLEDMLEVYLLTGSFGLSLIPLRKQLLYSVKIEGCGDVEDARRMAQNAIDNITKKADAYCDMNENKADPQAKKFLDELQYEIIKKAIKAEVIE